jgi:hypothetical protein
LPIFRRRDFAEVKDKSFADEGSEDSVMCFLPRKRPFGRNMSAAGLLAAVFVFLSSHQSLSQAQLVSIDAEKPSADCANDLMMQSIITIAGGHGEIRYFCTGSASFMRFVDQRHCINELCLTSIISNCNKDNCPYSFVLAGSQVQFGDVIPTPMPNNFISNYRAYNIFITRTEFITVLVGTSNIVVSNLQKQVQRRD